MLTRINEVLEEVPYGLQGWLETFFFIIIIYLIFFSPRETHRTEPIPGCADTAGSRHPPYPAPGRFWAALEKP